MSHPPSLSATLYKNIYINQLLIGLIERLFQLVPALAAIIIFRHSSISTLPSIHFRPNQHPTPGAPPTSPDGTPSIGMYY